MPTQRQQQNAPLRLSDKAVVAIASNKMRRRSKERGVDRKVAHANYKKL
jgi:hypothetical protein